MQTLTLTRPDDWHLHLRDGAVLAAVLPDTARRFARASVMPNLKPPVTPVALAAAYRARQVANGSEPLVNFVEKDKPTVIALREIAAGKVGLEILNRGQA